MKKQLIQIFKQYDFCNSEPKILFLMMVEAFESHFFPQVSGKVGIHSAS